MHCFLCFLTKDHVDCLRLACIYSTRFGTVSGRLFSSIYCQVVGTISTFGLLVVVVLFRSLQVSYFAVGRGLAVTSRSQSSRDVLG